MNAPLTSVDKARRFRIRDRLAPLSKAIDCLAESLAMLTPAERITVTEAAVKYRRIDDLTYRGPWDPTAAPYITEPADAATNRRYKAGVFIGPSRTLKTSGIVENGIAFFARISPRTIRVIAPTRENAHDFSTKKLDSMLKASPDLQERQEDGRGADTIYQKRFKGGMIADLGWPVISKLSQVDIPVIFGTDVDRMPLDIGGEGALFPLMRKRTQTYGSLGWAMIETSPGYEIKDPDWYAKTPHEAPPCDGAISHYNEGTRGRYYWDCPHCHERFEPEYHHIDYDKDPEKTPAERGATAVVICPNNGCVIQPSEKREMNARGYWLHEASDDDNGGLCLLEEHDRIRETDTLSWWAKGPVAGFQSWGGLVTEMLEAEETFKRTGVEADLKARTNTSLGLPYLSRIADNESELNADKLWNRANTRPLGVLPVWTRFFTVNVDVQNTRFPVQVTAFGPGLERATVDRFDLAVPPEDAPGADRGPDGSPRRALAPALYFEDWAVLAALESRVWPVEGQLYGLKPLGVTVDYFGEPGVTDNARRFWREMRHQGKPERFHLVAGVGKPKPYRVKRARPESEKRDKRTDPADVPVLYISSNPLKDEIAAGLLREDSGPNRHHLTQALGRAVFDELCAEQRIDGKWKLKPGRTRNEAFDLSYHAKALAIKLGAETINWDVPPEWALPGADNALAVRLEDNQDPILDIDPIAGVRTPATKPQSQTSNRAKRLAEWARSRTKR